MSGQMLAEKGISLIEWQKRTKKGKTSSKEIIKYYLEQIKKKNQQINAFLAINQKALQEAQRADEEIRKSKSVDLFREKPLLGLPIAVKDNFCTKSLPTTAASKVLENYIPPYDATVVQRLKKAGAIILGKTNMDAWAHGSSTETSGFGPTHNPYDLHRVPGGSSGGSTAAVAAAMTPAAIGSETAGSIRQPAAWCGLVGFKPTYGRISRYGLIAMASSLDCPGPITQTVKDAVLLYNILAGPDSQDATTIKEKSPLVNLKSPLPKNLKVGLCREYLKLAKKEIVQKIIQAAKILEKGGAKIQEVSLLDPKVSIAVYSILQRAEVSSNLARYDGIRYGRGRSYFGLEAKRRIILGTFVLSAGYFDQYYIKAQKARTKIIKDFERVFKKVDLIIGPTSPTVALKMGEWKKSPMFGEIQDVLVEPSALAGLPGININCGYNKEGLPIGLQIFGPQKSEELILKLAYRLEQWQK